MVLLGDTFPNFTAETSTGKIKFHDWLGNSWGILFSHPNDFTPVCTTELARVVQLLPEFQRLGVKVIGLSCNSVASHLSWIEDIKSYAGVSMEKFPYPIIEDESRVLATSLGMLDPSEADKDGIPLAARAVFIIDPNMKMRLSILYPATTGRNFDEIIRVIESLQLTDAHLVATPADWKKGDDVMVQPSVPMEEAKKKYGNKLRIIDLPSGNPYLRMVPQPIETSSE
ncbi:hypothetical protein PV327_005597 [Microctonus hyperodae]|uniref:1-Cys peroxiredoxin n=1 Tax=Microctonus hyperodae TaxID=165561 RepID=A0AA39G245_MICHY|nr:hypothetical protein PV327_005597 [Microctonus hyperodae]